MADVEGGQNLVKRRRSSGGIRRNASHDISDHLEKAPHLIKVQLVSFTLHATFDSDG